MAGAPPYLLLGAAGVAGWALGRQRGGQPALIPSSWDRRRRKQLYSAEPFVYAEPGDRVKVHLNLGTKWRSHGLKTWSVKDTRAAMTLGHVRCAQLKDVSFHVGRAGAKKALGGDKTVHAWVDGTLEASDPGLVARCGRVPKSAIRIRYNPHKGHTAFMRENRAGDWAIPVASAREAFLDPDWGVWAVGVVDQRKQRGGAAKEERFSPGDILLLDSPHTRGMPGLELRQVNYRGPLRGTDKAVVVLEGQQMTVPMEWLVKPWGGGKRIWPSWGKPRGGAARGRRAPVTPRLFHAGHEGYWWRRDTGTPFEKTRPERWIFYSPEGFQKAWVFQMEEPSDTNTPWMWLDGVSRSRGDDGTDPIAGWGSAEEAKADYVAWFRPYMGEKKGQSARKHSSRVSKCISGKVRGEGWEQRRAVAACLSMERGGSLRPDGSYIPKGSRSRVRRYKALDVSPHATSLSAYAGTVIQTLQREGPLTAAEIRSRVGGSEYSVQSHLDRLVRQDFIVEVSGRAPPKTRRRR